MLTKGDIIYRNNRASVKAIICCNDEYVTTQVSEAMPESPTVKQLVAVNSLTQQDKAVPEGFRDWRKEWVEAPHFRRPEFVNTNEDTMLMYFTSGTSGEPKMVAHDFLYAMGHLTTGCFWHNLNENSVHLTVADTGWGKAVWGKLYGQWFAGHRFCLRPREVHSRKNYAADREIPRHIILRASYHLSLHDS